jgi:hypothetical protein
MLIMLSSRAITAQTVPVLEEFTHHQSGWKSALDSDAALPAYYSAVEQGLLVPLDSVPFPHRITLFADSSSSNGAMTGDYSLGNIRAVSADLGLFGFAPPPATYFFLETEAGVAFRLALPPSSINSWTTLYAEFSDPAWARRASPDAAWTSGQPPSANDLSAVARLGIVLVAQENSSWEAVLDDVELHGPEPTPRATAGFEENFLRNDGAWHSVWISDTAEQLRAPIWNSFLGSIGEYPPAEVHTVRMMADASSSRGRLVGDYAAASVGGIRYTIGVQDHTAVDQYGLMLETTSGALYQYPWSAPDSNGWFLHRTMFSDPGWHRWEETTESWVPVMLQAADLSGIQTAGIIASSRQALEWSFELVDFKLLPSPPPVLLRLEHLDTGQYALHWTGTGAVYTEFKQGAPGQAGRWETIAGPSQESPIIVTIPVSPSMGVMRLRH